MSGAARGGGEHPEDWGGHEGLRLCAREAGTGQSAGVKPVSSGGREVPVGLGGGAPVVAQQRKSPEEDSAR